MGWFNDAVNRGVERGIEAALQKAALPGGPLDQAIDRAIWKDLERQAHENRKITGALKPAGFVWQVAFEFMRNDVPAKEAKALAIDLVRQYLKDEKIAYGHADYAWDQSAAIDLAREDMEYWECDRP